MLPKMADVLRAVQGRGWTINEAWVLIEQSSVLGFHPDVHVVFPERQAKSQSHFLTRTDFQGKEYRDRGRHSLFRNAWEAAGALCAAMNTPAGEAVLRMLAAGPVELRSRSALLGSPALLQRLRIEFRGTTTGVSYFDQRADHVLFLFVDRGSEVGLKTAYPVADAKAGMPAGIDVVTQGGITHTFPASVLK
jgi:hypothetical protein